MARDLSAGARASGPTKPSVLDGLGPRLRLLREERRLSLRALARRLGISPSAISQFETGKAQLSVSTLYAIVTELGISLDELFSGIGGEAGVTGGTDRASATGGSAHGETPEGRHVQRARRRRAIELETGVRWESLTPEADPEADFLYVTYDVGGASSQPDVFMRHAGREYGLVLSGRLEVTVGFEAYELGPGDSISFDSMVPHRLQNVGTEPVHGVWFVVGRQSDPRAAALRTPAFRADDPAIREANPAQQAPRRRVAGASGTAT